MGYFLVAPRPGPQMAKLECTYPGSCDRKHLAGFEPRTSDFKWHGRLNIASDNAAWPNRALGIKVLVLQRYRKCDNKQVYKSLMSDQGSQQQQPLGSRGVGTGGGSVSDRLAGSDDLTGARGPTAPLGIEVLVLAAAVSIGSLAATISDGVSDRLAGRVQQTRNRRQETMSCVDGQLLSLQAATP